MPAAGTQTAGGPYFADIRSNVLRRKSSSVASPIMASASGRLHPIVDHPGDLEDVLRAVDERHGLGPALGKLDGNRLADTAGGTCHDCTFPLNVHQILRGGNPCLQAWGGAAPPTVEEKKEGNRPCLTTVRSRVLRGTGALTGSTPLAGVTFASTKLERLAAAWGTGLDPQPFNHIRTERKTGKRILRCLHQTNVGLSRPLQPTGFGLSLVSRGLAATSC